MTTTHDDLLPGTRRALLHRIAVAQSEGRAPSLVAAVVRGGKAVWNGARTSVDGHGPDENVQYRIGSITKTFTAVLVLRLRDEGLLDLGDPLEKHVPGTGAGKSPSSNFSRTPEGWQPSRPRPGGSERPARCVPNWPMCWANSRTGIRSAVGTITRTPATRCSERWSKR